MTPQIVDIGNKPVVARRAQASGRLALRPATLAAIRAGQVPKGDVLTVARLAALQGAKRTPDWLPLCHPIPLEAVDVAVELEDDALRLSTTVAAHWRTGVEMEALTATAAGLLAAWDMVKPLEKDGDGQYPQTRLEDLRVVYKQKQEAVA